jgi:hypothetical protein
MVKQLVNPVCAELETVFLGCFLTDNDQQRGISPARLKDSTAKLPD